MFDASCRRARWWGRGLWPVLVLVLVLSACESAAPTATVPVITPLPPAPTSAPATATPAPSLPTAPVLPPTATARPIVPTVPVPRVPSPPEATATLAAPGVVQVNIVDFDFVPKVITVSVGTRIEWTNVGPTIHTVADQALTLFGSEVLNKGDRYSWTPTVVGTIPYWCTIHPDMLGTIIVIP